MRVYEAAILLVGGLYLYGRHKQQASQPLISTPTGSTMIPSLPTTTVQQPRRGKYPSRIGGIIFETNIEPGTAVVAGEPEHGIVRMTTDNVPLRNMRPTYNQL